MKRLLLNSIAVFIHGLFFLPLLSIADVTVKTESAVSHAEPSVAAHEITTVFRGTQLTLSSEKSDWIKLDMPTGQPEWILAQATDQQDRGINLSTKGTEPASESRHALVIGNGNYKNSPLKNPVNDASDMAHALQNLGFQVTLLIDSSHKDMVKYIRNFTNSINDTRGVGLFYYAGHGMQVKGKNYLIPVNANIEDEYQITYEGIDVGQVLEGMEKAGNQTNIVILDACRDNPFTRSFRSSTKGLVQIDAPSGTLIAYATAPGGVAIDGRGRNGVYTKHLLAQLSQPDVSVEIAMKQVRIGVMAETKKKQTPWESSSLVGEFCFSGSCGDDSSTRIGQIAPTTIEPINETHSIDLSATKPWYSRWYVWAAAVAVTAAVLSCSGGGDGGTAGQGGSGGGC